MRESIEKRFENGILRTETKFLNDDDSIGVNENGISIIVTLLNKKSKILETIFYNSDYSVIVSPLLKYAISIMKEDKDYYEIAFFDEFHNPVLNHQNVHKIIKIRSKELSEFSVYGIDGKLTQSSEINDNYDIERTIYDKAGNIILEEYFDKNNKRMNNSKGIAKYVFEFDNYNRDKKIKSEFFDKFDTPVCNEKGYAKYVAKYLPGDGFLITRVLEQFYDEKGQLIKENNKITEYERTPNWCSFVNYD